MSERGKSARPPALSRRLLERVLPPRDRDSFPGELDELFERRAAEKGPMRARWWYRAQVLSFALRLLPWRITQPRRREPNATAGAVLEAWLRDGRHAVRGLLRRPAFTAVAAVSLALGIGANTAVFSVVNAILIRRLPLPDLERWVEVYTSDEDGTPVTSSYPDIRDLREQGRDVFSDVIAYEIFINPVDRGGETAVLMGEIVSGNYFTSMQLRPWAGRLLAPQDDAPGAAPVAVLSHAYWTRELGADPGVIGQALLIRQQPFEIVGVAPPELTGTYPGLVAAAWVPTSTVNVMKAGGGQDRLEQRGNRSTFVKAHLAPGVTPERANDWMRAFSLRLADAYPGSNTNRVMSAVPSKDVALHPVADRALVPAAALVLVAVGTVLLIACVNLASFLLARAEDRRKEVALRLALGARRASLLRGFLLETVLLSLVGAGAGVLLAQWVLKLLVSFQPPLPVPVQLDVGIDRTVLLFTLVVSVTAGLFFGLIPGLYATRTDAAPVLKGEAARGSRFRLRGFLLVTQVAFSFLLLVGAGLFARSLASAEDISTGFYTGDAAILFPNLDFSGEQDPQAWAAFWTELEQRLMEQPGVEGVALTDAIPLGAAIQSTFVRIPGVPGPDRDGQHDIDFTWVSPGWFTAMDVPILLGRNFDSSDDKDGERVGIVSEAFVARMWPGENPVGRQIDVGGSPLTVIGVARDTKVRTLGEAPRPRIYFSHAWQIMPAYQVIVRGRQPSSELLAVARETAREVRPGLVLMEAKTMEQHLSLMLFPARAAAWLLGVFGLLALVLAATGIYGIVSHTVARGARDMGIRMSLGAAPSDVVRLGVLGGMRLVGYGGVIGSALAVGSALLVSRFLYGVAPLDPVTFASIAVVLLTVALLASWIPARRAAAVDPALTLRSE